MDLLSFDAQDLLSFDAKNPPCHRCEFLEAELLKLAKTPCSHCEQLDNDLKAFSQRIRELKEEEASAWPQIAPAFKVLLAERDGQMEKLNGALRFGATESMRKNEDLAWTKETVFDIPATYQSPHRASFMSTPASSSASSATSTLLGETSPFVARGRVCTDHAGQWLSKASASNAILVPSKDCDFCNAGKCDRCQSYSMQLARLNEPCRDCSAKQRELARLVADFEDLKEELGQRWYRTMAAALTPRMSLA